MSQRNEVDATSEWILYVLNDEHCTICHITVHMCRMIKCTICHISVRDL